MGSQNVRHDLVTEQQHTHSKTIGNRNFKISRTISQNMKCWEIKPTEVLKYPYTKKYKTLLREIKDLNINGGLATLCLRIQRLNVSKMSIPPKLIYRFNACMLICSVVSNSLWPHGLQPTRLLCPWVLGAVLSDTVSECLTLKATFEQRVEGNKRRATWILREGLFRQRKQPVQRRWSRSLSLRNSQGTSNAGGLGSTPGEGIRSHIPR